MSTSQSVLGCIRDNNLWLAQFNKERSRQAKRGRCTTLKRSTSGRLSWCQGKAHLKGGPCDRCLNESIEKLDGKPLYRVNNQTAGAADDHSGFNPRMLWFFVGMDKAAEDTRKASEESRD